MRSLLAWPELQRCLAQVTLVMGLVSLPCREHTSTLVLSFFHPSSFRGGAKSRHRLFVCAIAQRCVQNLRTQALVVQALP